MDGVPHGGRGCADAAHTRACIWSGGTARIYRARARVWTRWRGGEGGLLGSLRGAELQLGDAGLERSYLVTQPVLAILT